MPWENQHVPLVLTCSVLCFALALQAVNVLSSANQPSSTRSSSSSSAAGAQASPALPGQGGMTLEGAQRLAKGAQVYRQVHKSGEGGRQGQGQEEIHILGVEHAPRQHVAVQGSSRRLRGTAAQTGGAYG
jgi:hypothetical protein